jgi:hypothetical protein
MVKLVLLHSYISQTKNRNNVKLVNMRICLNGLLGFEVVVEEDKQDDISAVGSRLASPAPASSRRAGTAVEGVLNECLVCLNNTVVFLFLFVLESDEDDLAEILQATSSEDDGDN